MNTPNTDSIVPFHLPFNYIYDNYNGPPSNVKVVSRKLRFELPFVLLLADGFSAMPDKPEFETSGEPFTVTSEFGLLRIWFCKREGQSPTWLPREQSGLYKSENIGSINKNTSYSEVLVDFSATGDIIPIDTGESADIRYRQWISAIMDGLRLILSHYKVNNLKHYIPRVTEHAISVFGLYETYDNGATSVIPLHRIFEVPIPFENTVGEVEENKIREAVITGQSNQLHELFSEVWNKRMSQDWRLAAIDSVVLFEAWIVPFLKEKYKEKGLKSLEIKEKFKTGPQHYPMGISEICETIILDISGLDFKKTSIYKDLSEKSIRMRNKLVHGTQISVSKAQAMDSIWAVMNAVGFINAALYLIDYEKGYPVGTSITVKLPPHPFPNVTDNEASGILSPDQTLFFIAGDFLKNIYSA